MTLHVIDQDGALALVVDVEFSTNDWLQGAVVDDRLTTTLRAALEDAAAAASENMPAVYEEIWAEHLKGRLRASAPGEPPAEVWDLQIDFQTMTVAIRFQPHGAR